MVVFTDNAGYSRTLVVDYEFQIILWVVTCSILLDYMLQGSFVGFVGVRELVLVIDCMGFTLVTVA